MENIDDMMSNVDRDIIDKRFFCNISKAYDRVWHQGLVFKLLNFGFSANSLCLVDDY